MHIQLNYSCCFDPAAVPYTQISWSQRESMGVEKTQDHTQESLKPEGHHQEGKQNLIFLKKNQRFVGLCSLI